jgi:hypothetical protein
VRDRQGNGFRARIYPTSCRMSVTSARTRKNSWPTAPVTPTMAIFGPSAVLAARTTHVLRREARGRPLEAESATRGRAMCAAQIIPRELQLL